MDSVDYTHEEIRDKAKNSLSSNELLKKFSDAQCDAWAVYNLLYVLYEAMPEDGFNALPIKCTVSHIMDLAKKMPDTIELLEREARCHG
ncbi:hypothetical protein FHX57_002006 [Paraburkholderia tropica]|uniref:hypothetical protein n=1 Tax=Paraburkholderia tropica TaxID=92647 RepID=UPI00160E199B|nr:hypothetical protein [Paraburkholderia tropica]MBB2999675.1 hypothetical protein [Paraburkholderia tropica]